MGKGLCFPLSFLTLWGLMWLNGACFGVRFQRLLLPHPTPRSGGGGDHSYLWAPRMNQVHLEAPPRPPAGPSPRAKLWLLLEVLGCTLWAPGAGGSSSVPAELQPPE